MPELLSLDSGIQCGLAFSAQARETALELGPRIEAAGFDSLWVGDHISFHVPVPDPLTLLAFAAATTERIRLGTAVYLVPLRHPTTSAKVIATLDRLSGGRIALGVGVGGEFPPEFEASGVPIGERGSRTDEGIEIMRRLWSEDAVKHEGRHFQFGPVSIDPKPLQPGGPRILVGGRKAPSMRRAGRLGDGYISHMCDPQTFRSNLDSIAEHVRAAGRGEVAFESVCFIFTGIHDDHDVAHARASEMLGRVYQTDFREASKRYCLLGRAEDCLEQMQRFVDAGARHFVLSPLFEPERVFETAAQQILPELANLKLGSSPAERSPGSVS
jgi:probable F420-dependent oxidoreductase